MAVYVALGDSMSIDAYAGGAGRGAASLLHRNRDGDFPDWSGKDLNAMGMTAQILAADGAMSIDVAYEQLPLIHADAALVTITMGGNDIMTAYGDTAAAYNTIDEVEAVARQLLATLRRDESCQVVLTTVYDPSDGTGYLPSTWLPAWPEGPAVVRALNDTLADLAREYGAVLADVHQAFHGHGVTAGDPGQPEARPANTDLWYCGIIEPNAWGAHHIRATWWRALQASGWPAAPRQPTQ